LWYGGELPTSPGHPFYTRLNGVLDEAGLDSSCEAGCSGFYPAKLGGAAEDERRQESDFNRRLSAFIGGPHSLTVAA
jgi:hypothetical protein